MNDLSRSEYPAMLPHLQPTQAVQVLQERARRITKVNTEIADFLAERRRIEEQYVAGLRKLVTFKVPSNTAELGVFQPSWDALLRSIEGIANSHHQLSQGIDKDVEAPLRAFQSKREMTNLNTIANNLQGMAKELDDAQTQSDKLSKKGGKANASKVDAATQRLENATLQWESQAPYVFENLQALDEKRINHLRDVLTQLETHEVDHATRSQVSADTMLNLILEIKTEDEIQTFSQRIIQGRPRIERRFTNNNQTRQSSIAGSVSGPPPPVPPLSELSSAGAQQQAPPQTPPATAGGASTASAAPSPIAPQQQSVRSTAGSSSAAVVPPPAPPSREHTFTEQAPPPPPPPEKKLRSRIGTMLSRRRQSIHGGFGQLAPSKNSGPFNRISVSSHGPSISPRASYNNLADTNNRLGSLAENPDAPPAPKDGATNGVGGGPSRSGTASSSGGAAGSGGVGVADINTLNHMTVDEIFGVPPPPGPPPSQQKATGNEPTRDAEGYSVPAVANDPISLAQRDAAAASGGEQLGEGGDDQGFKVSIQNEPVQDEDPQAKKAALSNVANTLSLGMPTRKGGTVRGRRDVRNTIYVPAPSAVPESSTAASSSSAGTLPTAANLPSVSRSSTFGSFGSTATPTRPAAVAALASEASLGGGGGASDTQSVRSATSLNALANLKHTDSSNPGLNASIIETVTASFENGEVTSAKINGEIAFSYTAPPAASLSSPSAATATIRINNFPLLESIGPNRIFVQNTSSPDQFTLDTSHLQHKATAAFTFRAHADNATSLAAHCPLAFKPVWKPAGDKLNLLLQYRLNPASRLAATGQPVVLRNLVFIAIYEGRASNVGTKPPGTHLKDRHLVYWRMADVTLTEAWSKIVCRITGEQGAASPQPGHIEARWEYAVPASGATASDEDAGSISISQLQPAASNAPPEEDEEQDPFADDSLPSPKTTNGAGNGVPLWTDVPVARQIVSGSKYEAK